jgi:hypothetical protein
MALPKKIKKTLDLSPVKTGYDRRVELLDKINDKGTYLPKSLLHEDLDRGFLDFVKNNLRTVSEGKSIPVVDIILTTQNWAQFTQTWNFSNLDKNVEPPVITTVRTPEVKYGSLPSLRYNIPNRKQFFYAAVPTFNDGRKGYDIYTIPQPVPVDIKYSVRIICNRMRELNIFNKNVIETFASRQAYTQIKGHYIPIILDDIADESVMEMEKRKYYIQTYNFTLQGFLMDENEFEVKPAISRAITFLSTETQKFKRPKRNDRVENTDLLETVIEYSPTETDKTKDFQFTCNLYLDGLTNVDTYQVYLNGLYFGEDIFSSLTSVLQINDGDSVRFVITKTNSDETSKIKLKTILV